MSTVSAQSATQANVASSTSSVALFPAVSSRRHRLLFNDSTATLFVSFSGAASTTNFALKIAPAGFAELPQPVFSGAITGIWDAANGFARTTEY